MMERFRAAVIEVGDETRVGVLDSKLGKFAHFLPGGASAAEERMSYVVEKLNSGDWTTTGFVWEKADASAVRPLDATESRPGVITHTHPSSPHREERGPDEHGAWSEDDPRL